MILFFKASQVSEEISAKSIRLDYEEPIHNNGFGRNIAKSVWCMPKKIIGVYFIYNEKSEIVYIGKSINDIRHRVIRHFIHASPSGYASDEEINRHLKKQKEYSYFKYIEVPKDDVDWVEMGFISKHKPKFNIKGVHI